MWSRTSRLLSARTTISRGFPSACAAPTSVAGSLAANKFAAASHQSSLLRTGPLGSNSLTAPAVASLATLNQQRNLFDWGLRPYAAAAISGSMPLQTLNAGFSKVSLSLLVCPWKALPTALVILPAAYVVPAMFRMIFQNSSRPATSAVFNAFVHMTLMFIKLPTFENLFAEMTFYGFALFFTFLLYQFFPEIMLNDFMLMYYTALFFLPLLPLAMTYMPIFASRAYFFL